MINQLSPTQAYKIWRCGRDYNQIFGISIV
jgi:hypothetical protein